MLKTNSRKAKENMKKYITNHFNGDNYDIDTPDTFKEIAKIINDIFEKESYYSSDYNKAHHIPKITAFIDWCQGLPSILDTCYYYNRSAVKDLAGILEETENDFLKYDEPAAELLLTKLIYREISNAIE